MGDLPDYTREMVLKGAAGFTGLEELAARLGSIVPWDVKGNIVLMEDFESEETEWLSSCDALGSTATRSSRHKYSGDWACKLYVVGNIAAYAAYYRYFHFPGTSKYAAFARLCWAGSNVKNSLGVTLQDGTKEYYAEVVYDLLTPETLKVLSTGGAYRDVSTTLKIRPDQYAWLPVLLTFSLTTGYYDKLYFGDYEYDISDVPLYIEEAGYDPQGLVSVGAKGQVTEFSTYVDDIIIAKNVP